MTAPPDAPARTPGGIAALAEAFYAAQARLARSLAAAAVAAWRTVDPADLSRYWADVAPRLVEGVLRSQLAAAERAASYVGAAAAEWGAEGEPLGRVDPAGFMLDPLVVDLVAYQAVVDTKKSIAAGAAPRKAALRGEATLVRDAATMTADAGREATQAGIAAQPEMVGFYRKLVAPSCDRCIVLAGRFYRWNEGFRRHDACDCVHQPAADAADDLATDPQAYFRSLTEAEQNRVFGTANAQAIRDGADISQVVNARRGTRTADLYGRRARVTTQGTTVRAAAGRRLAEAGGATRVAGERYRMARTPRLSPAQICADADSRSDAVRLLRRFGYIA